MERKGGREYLERGMISFCWRRRGKGKVLKGELLRYQVGGRSMLWRKKGKWRVKDRWGIRKRNKRKYVGEENKK